MSVDFAAEYRANLRALAEERAMSDLPAGSLQILSPLMDAVSSGGMGKEQAKKALTAAASVGVTAGCIALSSGALAPVCGIAGGVVAGLLEGLMRASPPGKVGISYDAEMVPLLRQEKADVRARFFGQIRSDEGREKISELIDAFYDDRVLFTSSYALFPTAQKVTPYIFKAWPFNSSLFYREPWGGGFFSVMAHYYEVLPGKTDDAWWGEYIACLTSKNTAPCQAIEGTPLYLTDAAGTAARRAWAEGIWTYWLNKWKASYPGDTAEVKQLEHNKKAFLSTDWDFHDLQLVKTRLQMLLFPIMKRIFEDRASAIVAADVAEQEAPVLASLEDVTGDLIAAYNVRCDTPICQDYVGTKARRLARELVGFAARGPGRAEMDNAIREAEAELGATVQLSAAVEKSTVDDTRRRRLLALAAMAALAAAAYRYRKRLFR